MADSVDLSKLVGLIMEDPELIEKISALAKSEEKNGGVSKKEAPVLATPTAVSSTKESNRARLMSAIKPYLSESRARAVDTILSVSEVFGMIKGKE